jgi:hypothetical protein
MPDAYLIEAGDVSAGILVREDRHWRFYAAAPAFKDLDAQEFRRPRDATRAAERVAAGIREDAAKPDAGAPEGQRLSPAWA